MKKAFFIIFSLIGIGFIGLIIKGKQVQEIRTEIEISASPTKVWNILTDIESWSKWSPIIKASSGAATVGSEVQIMMMGKDGQDGPKYKPRFIVLEQNKKFQWRAFMMFGFLFTNDKVFELEQTATGTRLIHKELFSGLLAPIFCSKMEEGVPPMLNLMNQALKEFAEK